MSFFSFVAGLLTGTAGTIYVANAYKRKSGWVYEGGSKVKYAVKPRAEGGGYQVVVKDPHHGEWLVQIPTQHTADGAQDVFLSWYAQNYEKVWRQLGDGRGGTAYFTVHGNPSCASGELAVKRKGYTRSDGSHVKGASYCTPDKGKKGRGKKVFEIDDKKHALGGSGYLKKSAAARHKLLDACVRREDYQSCLGHVHALEVLGKRTLSKAELSKLAADRKYLVDKYGGPGSFGPRG